MKKYFTTGLAILLPILLTIIIVVFLVNILTRPFAGSIEAFLENSGWFDDNNSLWTSYDVIFFLSKILILCAIAGFILLIGFIGKHFLVDHTLQIANKFFHKVPYVNKIYKACQDVVHGLFSSKSTSFSQVVFVPFPNKHSLSVGLVTRSAIILSKQSDEHELIPVFVPGTPNPSVGFMLMFKRHEIIFADMKVDQAMKFVVSCGVVLPEFSLIKSENKTRDQNA